MENKPIAIIMPVHNSGKHLEPAIDSILDNTEYPFKLILIESESTDGTDKVCDRYVDLYDNVEVYHTKKEGITKAINFGIEKAGDLDVYLTQDDVILPNLYGRDWLTELVKGSNLDKCGVVTTFNAGGTAGQIYIKGMKWAGTWSLFIPRKTINKIGNFDENFSPGPGDDIDYSYRVHQAELRIYISDFWVDHHRQTENFNDNIEYIKMKNAGYFRKKHNIKPSWQEFVFDDEKFLIDDRTKTWYGCFRQGDIIDDPATMLYIKEITQDFTDDDLTLDIGANTGMMSLAVQKGKVIAFEPTPKTFDILENNAVINEWKNITPINEAVYDEVLPYAIQKANLNGIRWPGMDKICTTESSDKNTVMLDSYKFKNVRLIKIDTEGNDLHVLKGADKILDKYHPILIIEDIKEGADYLSRKGYTLIKKIGINSVWGKR